MLATGDMYTVGMRNCMTNCMTSRVRTETHASSASVYVSAVPKGRLDFFLVFCHRVTSFLFIINS